jgi:hypothetical protein
VHMSLQLSNSEELKWIVAVGSRSICVNRSCMLGISTSGGSECESLKLLKSEDQK